MISIPSQDASPENRCLLLRVPTEILIRISQCNIDEDARHTRCLGLTCRRLFDIAKPILYQCNYFQVFNQAVSRGDLAAMERCYSQNSAAAVLVDSPAMYPREVSYRETMDERTVTECADGAFSVAFGKRQVPGQTLLGRLLRAFYQRELSAETTMACLTWLLDHGARPEMPMYAPMPSVYDPQHPNMVHSGRALPMTHLVDAYSVSTDRRRNLELEEMMHFLCRYGARFPWDAAQRPYLSQPAARRPYSLAMADMTSPRFAEMLIWSRWQWQDRHLMPFDMPGWWMLYFDACLAKPVDLSRLGEKVDMLVRHHLLTGDVLEHVDRSIELLQNIYGNMTRPLSVRMQVVLWKKVVALWYAGDSDEDDEQ